MDVVLREASTDDAQLIAHLTRACWADKVAASSSGHTESADNVLHDLQIGGGFILIHHDEAIGSVRWLPLDGDSAVWEMRRMGILPAYRGEALSQYLLEAVIHAAQAAGIEELRLGVRADTPRLLDLYAAYQFELAPELEYQHANPTDAPPFVMRRFLKN